MVLIEVRESVVQQHRRTDGLRNRKLERADGSVDDDIRRVLDLGLVALPPWLVHVGVVRGLE